MENTQTTTKTPKLKLDFKDSKYATGRRKTLIAKVWLKKGSGKICVNGKSFNEYFFFEVEGSIKLGAFVLIFNIIF